MWAHSLQAQGIWATKGKKETLQESLIHQVVSEHKKKWRFLLEGNSSVVVCRIVERSGKMCNCKVSRGISKGSKGSELRCQKYKPKKESRWGVTGGCIVEAHYVRRSSKIHVEIEDRGYRRQDTVMKTMIRRPWKFLVVGVWCRGIDPTPNINKFNMLLEKTTWQLRRRTWLFVNFECKFDI